MQEVIVMVPVAEIATGLRVRQEYRHIESLAESLRQLGMLNPITLNSQRQLIAGARRLAAAKECGWSEVPCRVVSTLDDALKALVAERDENTCREPLRPSELFEIGRRIEELEKPEAEKRKQAGQPQKGQKVGAQGGGNFPPPSTGKTRDKVGAALGVSGKTYGRAVVITTGGVGLGGF